MDEKDDLSPAEPTTEKPPSEAAPPKKPSSDAAPDKDHGAPKILPPERIESRLPKADWVPMGTGRRQGSREGRTDVLRRSRRRINLSYSPLPCCRAASSFRPWTVTASGTGGTRAVGSRRCAVPDGLQGADVPSVECRSAERFLADPEQYVPACAGHDPVLLAEGKGQVPGKLDHCATYGGRLLMFSSPETLARFRKDPKRYAER